MFFFFTRFGLRGSRFGSEGMILSAVEAELHKDSIFDVKTYYFKGPSHSLFQGSSSNRLNFGSEFIFFPVF